MTLEPYQQRVVDEESELSGKFDRLGTFLSSDTFNELPFIDRLLLREQHGVMLRYLAILQKRIARFK